jgi:hypothetical protein
VRASPQGCVVKSGKTIIKAKAYSDYARGKDINGDVGDTINQHGEYPFAGGGVPSISEIV